MELITFILILPGDKILNKRNFCMNYNLSLVIRKLTPNISETTYWNNKNDTMQFNRFSSGAESILCSNPYPISFRYFFTPLSHLTDFFYVHCKVDIIISCCVLQIFSVLQKVQTLGFWGLDNQTRMKITMAWFIQFSNISSSLEVLNVGIDALVPFLL